jgi:ABC-type transport system involved in multi-copper enzyme maturation permease subunit
VTAGLIAQNTFREAARDRVLIGVIVAGIIGIFATQALSPLALGEGQRLTIDLGLSLVSLLGLLTVMMVGTSLVAKEIDRHTIYNLLSRPISRPLYLIGKWLGLSAVQWALAAALGLVLWSVLALRGAVTFAPSIAEAVYLAGLELTVLTALAVMFSALSTPVLSSLYTLGVFLVGQWSYDLRVFSAKCPPALAAMLEVGANVAPNLPLFNMRAMAADGLTTSWHHLAVATLYAALYSGCVLALAAAAFESRDFK